jgi:hypothetical protein
MLKRYLPGADEAQDDATDAGWTPSRYDDARTLIYRLRECHDRDLPAVRPHQELMDYTGTRVRERDLALSLTRGWSLARDATVPSASMPLTPLTRIVAPSHGADVDRPVPPVVLPTAATAVIRRPRAPVPAPTRTTAVIRRPRACLPRAAPLVPPAPPTSAVPECRVSLTRVVTDAHRSKRNWRSAGLVSAIGAAAALAAPSFIGDPGHPLTDRLQERIAAFTSRDPGKVRSPTQSALPDTPPQPESSHATNDRLAPQAQAAASPNGGGGTPAKSTSMASASPASPATPTPVADPPIKLAEAKPKVDASSSVARPASPTPNRARQAARAEAPQSSVPAATTHESVAAKVIRAPATRSAQHESAPALQVAHAAKPPHAAAPAHAVEIASAARSVGEPETATANPPKASAKTRSEDEPSTPSMTTRTTESTLHGETSNVAVQDDTASALSRAEPAVASAPAPTTRRERPVAKPRPAGPFAELLSIFAWHQRAAPVEERSFGSSKPAEPARRPWPRSQPTQNADATIPERPSHAPTTIASAPDPKAYAPPSQVVTAPPQVVTAPPQVVTAPPQVVTAPPQVVTAPMASATFPITKGGASSLVAQPSASSESPAATEQPDVRVSAPPTDWPGSDSPRTSNVDAHSVDIGVDELAIQGRRLVTRVMPDLATRAYDDLYPALSLVSARPDARQDRAIANVLHAPWRGESSFVPTTTIAAPRARRLHDEAWNDYVRGRAADDVLRLELAAFAANPRDPDIAGFLALLQLHANNANPESARQLALHAIAMSGAQRARRVDDWSTLAIASALAGRHNDATRLFLIQVALAVDVDRSCRAALLAYSNYGEPLRVPVQTMLARVHADPRAYDYPSCTDRLRSVTALRRAPL